MAQASVTFDGMTVESNTATEDQIRESLGAPAKEPAPVADPSTAAAAQPAAVETDDDAEDAQTIDPASEAGKTLAKRKQKYSERIGELTKNWRTAERERDAAKAEAARLKAEYEAARAPQSEPAAAQPAKTDAKAPEFYTRPKPREDEIGTKYQTYADYVEDLTEWKADEREAKRDLAQRQEAAHRSFQARVDKFNGQLESARSAHTDFDAVLAAGQDVIAPPHVIEFLLDSDYGRELQYRLLKDRAEFARIAKLPVLQAVAALGKLEDQVERARPAAAESGTSVEAPKTNAKPIPKPLGGSPVASDVDEASDDEPIERFIARENSKEAKARRR